jgi:hypothetical protein
LGRPSFDRIRSSKFEFFLNKYKAILFLMGPTCSPFHQAGLAVDTTAAHTPCLLPESDNPPPPDISCSELMAHVLRCLPRALTPHANGSSSSPSPASRLISSASQPSPHHSSTLPHLFWCEKPATTPPSKSSSATFRSSASSLKASSSPLHEVPPPPLPMRASPCAVLLQFMIG